MIYNLRLLLQQLSTKSFFKSLRNSICDFPSKLYHIWCLAIDLTPGLNLWKLEIRRNGQNQHDITYDNGVIFAGMGKKATLLALNATDGKVIWQTIPAGDPNKNYITQGPPTVWKNIALIGLASSSGPITPDLKGKVTAFNRTNGEKLWSFTNTVGPRIQCENATKNGGATTCTG